MWKKRVSSVQRILIKTQCEHFKDMRMNTVLTNMSVDESEKGQEIQ